MVGLAAVAGSDAEEARKRWRGLVERVLAALSPDESPAFGELYLLAIADGLRVLRGFRALSEEELRDVVAEKFVREWASILTADRPRAYFLTAVKRAAISALRKKGTAGKHQEALLSVADDAARTEDDTVTTLELAARLRRLSPRDQQIVRAVHSGEDREEVALCFRTSRANIDQICSRVARVRRDE
jgi:DNA-directed RNA polymerase specialized sigma24 family protein